MVPTWLQILRFEAVRRQSDNHHSKLQRWSQDLGELHQCIPHRALPHMLDLKRLTAPQPGFSLPEWSHDLLTFLPSDLWCNVTLSTRPLLTTPIKKDYHQCQSMHPPTFQPQHYHYLVSCDTSVYMRIVFSPPNKRRQRQRRRSRASWRQGSCLVYCSVANIYNNDWCIAGI